MPQSRSISCSSLLPMSRAASISRNSYCSAKAMRRQSLIRIFLLQREGYAAAISDPHVVEAIRSGPHQRVAVCFVEWSGVGAQKLVIDWTMIDGPGAARKFGDQLLELPRSFADRTSISGAIEFAV